MKYLLISGILLFSACDTQDAANPEAISKQLETGSDGGIWQLVEMSGSFSGIPPTTGDDMEWQETYTLFADNTFTKERQWEGEPKESGGTYQYVTLSDGEFLELSHASENNLIGNCTGDLKELLWFKSENKLEATWRNCDGPGLVYEKVNEGGAAQ